MRYAVRPVIDFIYDLILSARRATDDGGWHTKALTLVVFLIVLASIAGSGCAGAPSDGLGNPDFGPYGQENYARTLEAGSYSFHQFNLPAGTRANITVASDGRPVNVLVLDPKNLGQYRQALSGFKANVTAAARKDNVTSTSFIFASPGTYYLVVEQAKNLGGLASPGTVQANVTIEYQRRR